MVVLLFKEISADSLKDYVVYSINCYVRDGRYILQPNNASVTFNFKNIEPVSCVILIRRESGNGVFTISGNKTSKEHQINSKSNQGIIHTIGEDGSIRIFRTARGRGEISIIGVSLYINQKSADEWSDEVSKCENHTCISILKDKLYASDGGWMLGYITTIKTNPVDSFIKTGNMVRFLRSCQITDLEVEGPSKVENQIIKPKIIKSTKPIKIELPVLNSGSNIYDQKQYTRQVSQSYATEYSIDVESTIDINSYSGMLWLSQIHPFIPNVINCKKAQSSISSITKPIAANNMYIEGFCGDIPNYSIEALNIAKRIFVSSNTNAESIRNAIGNNKEIRVISKVLPYIKPQKLSVINDEYILISNNNSNITDFVINSIKDIQIVLLNASGKYPNNVFPINEYISYENLVYLFNNAKCYIYLPEIEDQISGFTDLALGLGTQVITSSWGYMGFPEIIFINKHINNLRDIIKLSKKSIPNIDGITKSFNTFIDDFLA